MNLTVTEVAKATKEEKVRLRLPRGCYRVNLENAEGKGVSLYVPKEGKVDFS